MSSFWLQKRDLIDRQIRKGGALCYLRRASVDRECWALEMQLNANDKRALRNLNNRIFSISAVDLDVPPDQRLDSLVLVNKSTGIKLTPLRMAAPVAPFQPEPGGTVVYYDVEIEGNAG